MRALSPIRAFVHHEAARRNHHSVLFPVLQCLPRPASRSARRSPRIPSQPPSPTPPTTSLSRAPPRSVTARSPTVRSDLTMAHGKQGSIGALEMPALVFGAATLSGVYNDDALLDSDIPLRTVRLALRYGINAFDTSPYYGVSEIILGKLLQDERIAKEFPRSTYKITTKCGRYGFKCAEFDYSPATVRASVQRSLQRLGTDYLDVVLLHDVEFVATPAAPSQGTAGRLHAPLTDSAVAADWGLAPGADDHIGEGDITVLEAVKELFKMKEEGIIRAVGISGYTLPTLLRLARLIARHIRPLDTLLSFSNYNLQNASFALYAPYFLETGIRQLSSASPFSMGLLTPKPPAWHPAPAPVHALVKQAAEEVCGGLEKLPDLALGFSLRRDHGGEALKDVPSVVGLSNLRELHETVRVWREVHGGSQLQDATRREKEVKVREMFKSEG
ncbi:Aldo/keto reductase, partial [Exidia glandulosa HHB12029]